MGWGGIIAQALAGGASGAGEALASQGLMEQKAEMERQREEWMSQLRMKETEVSQTRQYEFGQKAAEAASVREVDVYGKKKAADIKTMPEEQRIKTEGEVEREKKLAPLKRDAAVEIEKEKQKLWNDPEYYKAAMREAAAKRDPNDAAVAKMRLEIAKIDLEFKKQEAKLNYTDRESIKLNSEEQKSNYADIKALRAESAKSIDPEEKKRIDADIREKEARNATLSDNSQKILDKTRSPEEVAARKAESDTKAAERDPAKIRERALALMGPNPSAADIALFNKGMAKIGGAPYEKKPAGIAGAAAADTEESLSRKLEDPNLSTAERRSIINRIDDIRKRATRLAPGEPEPMVAP